MNVTARSKDLHLHLWMFREPVWISTASAVFTSKATVWFYRIIPAVENRFKLTVIGLLLGCRFSLKSTWCTRITWKMPTTVKRFFHSILQVSTTIKNNLLYFPGVDTLILYCNYKTGVMKLSVTVSQNHPILCYLFKWVAKAIQV